MKKILLKSFATLAFFSLSTIASAQTFDWAKQLGGTDAENSTSIKVDASGNVYTVGSFKGTADFDPSAASFTLASVGLEDIYISKLDASGNFLWAKQIGSLGSDVANAIALDASGNCYVTGYFEQTVDFDPSVVTSTLVSLGSIDIFILKLDAAGNFNWVKQIGGTGIDIAKAINIDASGNVYTTGYFYGTVDFNPGASIFNLTSSGSAETFISKLDAAGNFIWAKQSDCNGADDGASIVTDASGNVYISGTFQGTAYFSGFSTAFLTANGRDAFVVKLNSSGTHIWSKQIGGPGSGNEFGYAVAVDATGNVYTTGKFYGFPTDFDPGASTYTLSSSSNNDAYVSKLDASGNFVWAKQIGGPLSGDDIGNSITIDATGNVLIAGNFTGTTDFDPSPATYSLTSVGTFDVFILTLNASGNFLLAQQFVAGFGNSITTDASNNIYLTGNFGGLGDFDPSAASYSITGFGGDDAFVLKLNPCALNTNVARSGNTLTAALSSATYQWVDCATGNSPISGAINQAFTPTVTGNYAVIISSGGCVNTSTCTNVCIYNVPVNVLANGTILAFGSMYTGSPTFQWVDCNNSNAPIAGATNAMYTPTITGSYALTFSNGTCVNTSTCNTISVATGIYENSLLNAITLQPNPASTQFTLNNVLVGSSLSIMDVTGKVVYTKMLTELNETIETTNLANGIYVVQLKNNGAVAHKKLIISK